MDPIFERVSIRQWTDQPVEEEKIEQILKAAMQAPSAMNAQPWQFIVVTSQAMKDKLAAISPYAHFAAKAPVLLALLCRKENRCPEYNQVDMGICIENILLEATEQSLGAVCLGVAPLQDRMAYMKEALQLGDDVEGFALIPIGYPKEEHPQTERYDPSRIAWIR